MRELVALVEAWGARRSVRAASIVVGVAAVAGGAACTWRMDADQRSASALHQPVDLGQLVDGHRYLLLPWVLVALVAVGLAGSVASHDAASGLAAQLALHRRTIGRGVLAQVAAAAIGAALWFACIALAVLAVGVLAVAIAGGSVGSARVTGELAGPAIVILLRLLVSVGGLAAVAAVVGLARPGSSVPAVIVPLGIAAAEVALLVLTNGDAQLLMGSSWSVAALGGAALDHGAGPAWIATWLPIAWWLVAPVLALLRAVRLPVARPLPS